MTTAVFPVETAEFRLRFSGDLELSHAQFFAFCQVNPDVRIERTAQGEFIIMPPTRPETGRRNSSLTAQLYDWAARDGSGIAFDSSTGFDLPNGATRSPGASWIRKSKLATVPGKQGRGFLKICPDFVVELRSETDSLQKLRVKMEEYIANGAELGWLIDPETRTVHIYRRDQPVGQVQGIDELSGDPLLRGFQLDLRPIWMRQLSEG